MRLTTLRIAEARVTVHMVKRGRFPHYGLLSER
jgi:hypothetical protein